MTAAQIEAALYARRHLRAEVTTIEAGGVWSATARDVRDRATPPYAMAGGYPSEGLALDALARLCRVAP